MAKIRMTKKRRKLLQRILKRELAEGSPLFMQELRSVLRKAKNQGVKI